MFYTGYYALLKKYKDNGLFTVGISGSVPPFYEGARILEFAPRKEMFNRWKNGEIDNFRYHEEYVKYLDSLDKKDVRETLNELKEHGDVIFLCYEKSGVFCHRHILADWLENNFGEKVDEYGFDS